MHVDRSLCFEAVVSLGHLSAHLFRRLLDAHEVAFPDAAALWDHRDDLPVALVDAIHHAFDLSREVAVDPLLIGPRWATPLEEVVHVLLEDPERFRSLYAPRASRVERAFQEFVGRDELYPYVGRSGLGAAEDRLRAIFGGHAFLDLHPWLAPRALQFAIRFRDRPCDLVMFHPRARRLAISAPSFACTREYVAVFGELLARDTAWFSTGPVVSLGPLAWTAREALRPTPGLAEVRLVEVGVVRRSGLGEVTVFHSNDAVSAVEQRAGELSHVRLRLRVSSGEWRSVLLAVPDGVAYDWRQDGEVVRAFLEERGFLAGPEPALCRAA